VSFVIHEHLDKYAMGGQAKTKVTETKDAEKKMPPKNADLIVEEKEVRRSVSAEDEKAAKSKEEKEIAKVEKDADNAKVTMKHFEDAVKKVREQKDLKIGQKVELSAFR
jgi:transitional endoplasmic reticulum ATPase